MRKFEFTKSVLLGLTLLILPMQVMAQSSASPVQITFEHKSKIPLNVQSIDMTDAFREGPLTTDIEKELPITPQEALTIWVQERLSAQGADGHMQVQVMQASVEKEEIQVDGGLMGFFKNEQDKKLTARLKVRITYASKGRRQQSYVDTEVSRSRTFAEKMSLNDREAAEIELISSLIADFDVRAEESIYKHMGMAIK